MITRVGSVLKTERIKQGISLADVEKATRIRKKNIRSIESEKWEDFPSRTYIQGIITQYGRFLGLEDEKLAAYFRRAYENQENLKFKQRTVKDQFTPRKKIAMRFFIASIILFFCMFFGYQMYLYLRPPEIVILEPTVSTFRRTDKVLVRGQAPKETVITVNKREVYLDDDNIFEAYVPLTEDRNLVVIEAIGANGQKTVIRKVFIRK